MSNIKCMKMLGNTSRGLISTQKRLLYRCCILFIALYGFQLWYYNKVLLSYPLKLLQNIQRRATLWIVEVFHISPTTGIEVIAGLIPIHFHIQKLNSRFHLRVYSLLANNIISTIEARPINHTNSHHFSLELLTSRQCSNIKSLIVDIKNRFNENFSLFFPFNCEFLLGNRLIDIFPKHFSFHSLNRKYKRSIKSHLGKLKEIILYTSSDLLIVLVVSDTSIKNHVATSIAHVYVHGSPVIKTIHHAVNIISTKDKLFVIRCSINKASHLLNIKRIVIISDSIYIAKIIFNSLVHLY